MEGRKEEMKPIAFSEREVDLGRSDVTRRAELADWIVGAENPWFAKAFVESRLGPHDGPRLLRAGR